MASRFSIGIDLGTSNCALSYIDKRSDNSDTQVLAIPQYASLDSTVEKPVLPSFLYFLTNDETQRLGTASKAETTLADWRASRIVGTLAREQSGIAAERVVHSAKSWLCHAGIDRESNILPWASEAIAHQNKLSPVAVSAAYLNYLRYIWDQLFARDEHNALFNRQDVVITVPASFDSVAQQLTLEAAKEAGFSEDARLLEEPMAAFYNWLRRHHSRRKILEVMPDLANRPHTVLVCDIGGGTSDFSLFEVEDRGESTGGNQLPDIRRIAVSDHILLGGDNIDLALAHRFEAKMNPGEEGLSVAAWSQLVSQCRVIKERILSKAASGEDELCHVSVSEGGSGLFAAARSAAVSKEELRTLVTEGFFAYQDADTRPEKRATGLREIGLPYARDPQVFKHLAGFLQGRKVDAVLFNGGTVAAPVLRRRIQEQLEQWQPDRVPVLLENEELHLAVARGAAFFLLEMEREAGLSIGGGSGHSLYLEIRSEKKHSKRRRGKKRLAEQEAGAEAESPRYAVCISPQGTEVDVLSRVSDRDLHLLINKPVRFQPFYSTKRPEDAMGEVVRLNEDEFQPMAPLQTLTQLPPGTKAPKNGKVQVELQVKLNSVGLLRLDCVSARRIDGQHHRWRLNFNLRASGGPTGEEGAEKAGAVVDSKDTGVSTEALEEALRLGESYFGETATAASSHQVARLLKDWEKITRQRRKNWNTALLRRLWEPLGEGLTRRSLSAEHELAWIMAAGFVLRPGYGFPFDDVRIQRLWFIEELGLCFPEEKPIREQRHILWRRTAGGLHAAQQERLYEDSLELIRANTKASREAIRMAGALERLPMEKRTTIARLLLAQVVDPKSKQNDAQVWALGRLLSRAPLYGGESSVLPPTMVEEAFTALRQLDWEASPALKEGLSQLFAQACRKVESRALDVSSELRESVLEKLEAVGCREHLVREVREFVPLEETDMQMLFGESLPAGLIKG